MDYADTVRKRKQAQLYGTWSRQVFDVIQVSGAHTHSWGACGSTAADVETAGVLSEACAEQTPNQKHAWHQLIIPLRTTVDLLHQLLGAVDRTAQV
jgi:hypothetical protein